jgi:hypothetical protein
MRGMSERSDRRIKYLLSMMFAAWSAWAAWDALWATTVLCAIMTVLFWLDLSLGR